MQRLNWFMVQVVVLFFLGIKAAMALPEGFVFLDQEQPTLKLDLRYPTDQNFMGRPVDGYIQARPVLTQPAAQALGNVLTELEPFGLTLVVFDAYRPQRAVDHFVRWAKDPADVVGKAEYYPDVDKSNLFSEGYIAARSGHSRGSTVDLSLASLTTGEQLDMGSPFDFFGKPSWPSYAGLTTQQRANRMLLQTVMKKHGFKHYDQEWWHFTLLNEPFPDQYFDFLPR